jgi:hypothetical protein
MYSDAATARRIISEMKENQNMSNFNYNVGQFKGKLTGKTYDSLEAMRHCERLEAMRRAVPTEDEAAFDDLPAEKIKELFARAAKSEQEKADLAMSGIDLQTFFELNPAYVDCQQNTTPIVSFLRARGIKAPTLSDMQDAYDSLKAAGLLVLNQAVLQKQRKGEIADRAKEIEAARALPDDDELYSLLLEEVRRRATTGGWLR